MALTAQSRFSTFFEVVSASAPLRQSMALKGLLAEESPARYMIGVGAGRYSNQLRRLWPDQFPLHA